jgi:predicted PurR-regulated permease PerM
LEIDPDFRNEVALPFYHKVAQSILALVAFFFILYIGQNIIIPLVFALIIAILLNPLVNFFHRKGINRIVAIILAILITVIVLSVIFYFIGSQVNMFREALPVLNHKFKLFAEDAILWVSEKLNIPKAKVDSVIETKKDEGMNRASYLVGNTLIAVSSVIFFVLLIPVYIFLFLFYKPLLLDFISQLFPRSQHKMVAEILFTTKALIQSYLLGLLIEMVIVAILNTTVLLIIGVEYAVVFGVIGAILNVIPYIGGIVAISLPMIMAFITISPLSAFFVFVGYVIVQLIDNNILVPGIVASKVKINALISIVVVFIGGALWGVAGMFLSIPVTAILKVICDHIQPLKPLGFLIGDNMPRIGKDVFKFDVLRKATERNSTKE